MELPSSLKMFMEYHCHDIHDTPFPLCDSIKRVVCHAIKPPTAIDPFSWAVYQNCQLVVPEGCEDAYRAASGWKKFYNIACDISELTDESMVDVYDLRGVMVRRKARVKDLEKELPKGVYVTHGKKFIVK